MREFNFGTTAALLALGVFALAANVPTSAQAQASAVDPAATKILKKMTDYVSGLDQFGVRTQVTLEDVLDSGHRIDMDISARVSISRPDKLRAERSGDLVDQVFYYDGKTLTLYDPSSNLYATEPAPGSIEELLDYARETLGLIIPIADLAYRNAYALLMQDVTAAMVVGKSMIGGVKCDHLLFSRPGVDFQVWVSDTQPPLPYKYVVTDTENPGWVSITTVMSGWKLAPNLEQAHFNFVPPTGAKSIPFLYLDAPSAPSR
jgi:hypothetical protein